MAHEPAVEVRVRSGRNIALASYTAILDEVRHALDEVDHYRLPGRNPRLDWAIRDMRSSELIFVSSSLLIEYLPSDQARLFIGLARGLSLGLPILRDVPKFPNGSVFRLWRECSESAPRSSEPKLTP